MDEHSRRLHIDADVLYDRDISKILRAAAVTAMTLFSVYVLTGSFGKALLISAMSGANSLFGRPSHQVKPNARLSNKTKFVTLTLNPPRYICRIMSFHLMAIQRHFRRLRDLRFVRGSGFFDESFYLAALPASVVVSDPLTHYFDFGERIGLAPNAEFDPLFYARSNPDVAMSGGNLYAHYLRQGIREGRQSRPVVKPPEDWAEGRETVLLVVHEMSRTGAPVLGWNILRELKRLGRRVVVISLGDGDLRDSFLLEADFFIDNVSSGDIQSLAKLFRPAYAICNSVMTAPFGQHLEGAGIRTVGLVHEFGAYIGGLPGAAVALENWSVLVFPAEVVRASVTEKFPPVALRQSLVLPQGKSIIPRGASAGAEAAPIRSLRDGFDFIVLGAGSVELRKGNDLFIAASADTARKAPELNIRFVWVGGRPGDASDYLNLLKEQVVRSGVTARFELLDNTEHLENVYRNADVFFLSSRLDPLPNVTIDAASIGLPVVCFENATGMAEFMAQDEVCRQLIVPYADVSSAADLIIKLARDREWATAAGAAMRSLAVRTFDMERYVIRIDELGMGRGSMQLQAAAE